MDPSLANDTLADHNKVHQQLNIKYILKITKIVVVILNFSFLLGMFWYIMCKLIEDVFDLDYNEVLETKKDGQAFIPYYGL